VKRRNITFFGGVTAYQEKRGGNKVYLHVLKQPFHVLQRLEANIIIANLHTHTHTHKQICDKLLGISNSIFIVSPAL
jgi:hypothetical protein